MQIVNEWLEEAKNKIVCGIFEEASLGDKCHISYGFPSRRSRSMVKRAIGEAWQQEQKEAIFISPSIFNEKNHIGVLGVLCHEIIHIKIGVEKGHRGEFKRCMKDIGLEGKATATFVGEDLAARLNDLGISKMPPMNLDISFQKKQGTRLIKLICDCERILRVSRKTIEEGSIICGLCGKEFVEEED